MLRDVVILIMEIIGTVAFSVSGALVAISCSLDLFGVTIVGCVTAVGGGIIRDILIGSSIPLAFANTKILFLAVVTAIIVFVIAYINSKKFMIIREEIERINNFFDALGLAAFSITGIEIACTAGHADRVIFVIAMGVITGVGGGILRDVLVNKVPYILEKHIYALVSVFGCVVYYLIRTYTGYEIVGTFIVTVAMVLARMLAARYRWKLPKIKFENGKDNI